MSFSERPVVPAPIRAPNYAPAPIINQPRPRKIIPILMTKEIQIFSCGHVAVGGTESLFMCVWEQKELYYSSISI